MRRPMTVAFCLAYALIAARSFAQPDLPPPPPPPIGQGDLTPAPPLPVAPAPRSPPPPHRASPPPAPPSPPAPPPPPPQPSSTSPPRFGRHRPAETAVVVVEEDRGRPAALTFNPIALTLGRLSGNVELWLAPHHAFVASPNVLVAQVERGGRYNLVSEGFGFATRLSSSFGIELGYHYWLQAHRSLRGVFLGPSLLLGGTTDASAGDPSHMQGYWGLAFDAGLQEVLRAGFTIGGGVGLGVLRMADATALFPRVLLQVGWSF